MAQRTCGSCRFLYFTLKFHLFQQVWKRTKTLLYFNKLSAPQQIAHWSHLRKKVFRSMDQTFYWKGPKYLSFASTYHLLHIARTQDIVIKWIKMTWSNKIFSMALSSFLDSCFLPFFVSSVLVPCSLIRCFSIKLQPQSCCCFRALHQRACSLSSLTETLIQTTFGYASPSLIHFWILDF